MLRIVIAGDAAASALADALQGEPGLAVVGQAALDPRLPATIRRLKPEAVVLVLRDSALAVRDATHAIMTECPTPVVIATGPASPSVAEASMPALREGALTVVEIPPAPGAADHAQKRRTFVATVQAMAQVKVVRSWPRQARAAAPVPSVHARPRGCAVAIGASTGGPSVLHEILSRLKPDLPAPILIVQHIAPGFIKGFTAWLGENAGLPVKLAEAGERLAPGMAYLAPDDRHLCVDGDRVTLSATPAVAGFRPAATQLFQAVAANYRAGTIAVVLTGMGTDGVEGLRAVRAAGGRVLVQDEPSSVVYGMPGAAVSAGLADEVLPPAAIAARIDELSRTLNDNTTGG